MSETGIVVDETTPARGYKLPNPENAPYYDIQRISAALQKIEDDIVAVLNAINQKVGPDAINTLKEQLLGGASGAFDTLKELADKDAADVASLMALLGQKAAINHPHEISSINGLADALSGRATHDDLQQLQDDLLGGASGAFDTLKELADKDAADVAQLMTLIGQKAASNHSHTLSELPITVSTAEPLEADGAEGQLWIVVEAA